MKIDLSRVRDGKNGEFSFSYDLDLSDLICAYDRPFHEPVRVSGTLSDRCGIMELTFHVDAKVETLCARCAKEIRFTHRIDTKYIVSEKAPKDGGDDSVICAENGELDLDEVAKTALILSMDTVYLCSDDCRGLCPKCGADLNDGPCGCKKEIDPRLAKLQEFLEK